MSKFDVEKVTNDIMKFIKKQFKDNNLDGIVMGISGGKDSTIASALFVRALGPENVIGITMPCHSIISDESDAQRIADFLRFRLYNLDLTEPYDVFEQALTKELGIDNEEILREPNINLKPRMRMSSLYYFAQVLSNKNKKRYVVAGTGNKCEITIGYFTKWGDGASDINILGDLTVSEVLAIGDYLGLPKDLVHKTPSDGLSGKSDEEKLGFTYNEVESFINGENNNQKIENMHRWTSHKRRPITIFEKNSLDNMVFNLIDILGNKNKTISTMESCTSGLLASTITNLDGASSIIKYSAVTYCDEYKIKMGVDSKVINKYTVYSIQVAEEMAKAISTYTNSNYGVGITGVLGEADPNYPDSEINKVYISLYNSDNNEFKNFTMKVNEETRDLDKQRIVYKTLQEIIEFTQK